MRQTEEYVNVVEKELEQAKAKLVEQKDLFEVVAIQQTILASEIKNTENDIEVRESVMDQYHDSPKLTE